MIDEKKLSSFWDKNVPDEFKHFTGTAFDRKINKYIKDIKKHVINIINFKSIEYALDWGCGGGIGSLLLSEDCNVSVLDISENSLLQCESYLESNGKKLISKYLLGKLEDIVIKEKIDLLFSISVVQHFPSYEYWKQIAEFWNKLNSKYIAIQTRHGKEIKSNENEYFNDVKNYILGLYLTTEEVIDSFISNYNLTYHYLENDNYSMYEYFVFKLK